MFCPALVSRGLGRLADRAWKSSASSRRARHPRGAPRDRRGGPHRRIGRVRQGVGPSRHGVSGLVQSVDADRMPLQANMDRLGSTLGNARIAVPSPLRSRAVARQSRHSPTASGGTVIREAPPPSRGASAPDARRRPAAAPRARSVRCRLPDDGRGHLACAGVPPGRRIGSQTPSARLPVLARRGNPSYTLDRFRLTFPSR
jgi:hypothetical protein